MKLRLVLLAFLATVALVAGAAPAASFTDQLGDQPVTLPLLDGFGPAGGRADRMRDFLARALPPNYRLIGVQIAQESADPRPADATGSIARYMTVLTYRNYEASGLSPATFEAIKKAMREQGGQVMKAAQAQISGAVDKMNKELAQTTGDATAKVDVGTISSLGMLDEQADSFLFATVGPVSVSSKQVNESRNQVAVVAVVLLHGKPINANFYSSYESKDDLEWAQAQARDWVQRAKALNP